MSEPPVTPSYGELAALVVAQAGVIETLRGEVAELRTEVAVFDLAAVAIARLAWRDSPLENWHAAADSRISDAELMRATVNVTRRVRGLLDVGSIVRPAGTPGPARRAARTSRRWLPSLEWEPTRAHSTPLRSC
jgi:hypothetical protein